MCMYAWAYIYMCVYNVYTLYIYVNFSNPTNCRHPRHHQSWRANPQGKMPAADDMMSS